MDKDLAALDAAEGVADAIDDARLQECAEEARRRGLWIREVDYGLFHMTEKDTGALVAEPIIGIDELEDFLGIQKS